MRNQEFDWSASGRTLLERLVDAMSGQPASVERELHQVDILADPVGQEVLGNLVRGRDDLAPEIEQQPNQQARALALLLMDIGEIYRVPLPLDLMILQVQLMGLFYYQEPMNLSTLPIQPLLVRKIASHLP